MLPSVFGSIGWSKRACQRPISTAVTSKTVFLTLSGFTNVILAFTHSPPSTRTLMG
jgi:hypothetical protein